MGKVSVGLPNKRCLDDNINLKCKKVPFMAVTVLVYFSLCWPCYVSSCYQNNTSYAVNKLTAVSKLTGEPTCLSVKCSISIRDAKDESGLFFSPFRLFFFLRFFSFFLFASFISALRTTLMAHHVVEASVTENHSNVTPCL